MPCDYSRYPADWFTSIRPSILERADDRCEGSPKYPDCHAKNGEPHPVTKSKVILTIAHVDHDVSNNAPENLRAWCQRCHLTHDAGLHADTRRRNRTAAATSPEAA